MIDKEITIKHSNILQLNHVVRNRLNSLLGFIDILCYSNELSSEEKQKYLNVIKTLSMEIHTNLDDYLAIPNKIENL